MWNINEGNASQVFLLFEKVNVICFPDMYIRKKDMKCSHDENLVEQFILARMKKSYFVYTVNPQLYQKLTLTDDHGRYLGS